MTPKRTCILDFAQVGDEIAVVSVLKMSILEGLNNQREINCVVLDSKAQYPSCVWNF